MMRLSQSHLSLFERCPQKFQATYLDQLVAPLSPEDESRREWGNQFHLMMQQRELGLDPVPGSQAQESLHAAVDALVTQLPDVFRDDQASNRVSEQRRTLEMQSSQGKPYLLTAVYDLVFFGQDQAIIFDWKTYPRPQKRQWLAKSWQTRLYPFILVETMKLEPEQVSMMYWFVDAREGEAIAPQSITFSYDTLQHETTRQHLLRLLDDLSRLLAHYEQGHPMPKLPEHSPTCEYCQFAVRCGRSPSINHRDTVDPITLLDIDTIAEIPL